MPAPTAVGYAPSPVSAAAPGSTRPAWSAHLRIAAWVVIVVKVIFVLDCFVPYDFTYLKYFIAQFTDPFFWFLLSLDAAVVVALGLAMVKRLSVLRYVVAAAILVNCFVFIPVLIASMGGDWVRAFAPPQWLVGSELMFLRSLFMWTLKWLHIVAAIVLLIPDRKSAGRTQPGFVPAPGAAPAGQFPPRMAAPQGSPATNVPPAPSAANAGDTSGFVSPQ